MSENDLRNSGEMEKNISFFHRIQIPKYMIQKKNYLVAILLVVLILIGEILLYKQAFRNLPRDHFEWLSYSEEHFNIGLGLYENGRLENGSYINTERPPGYPIYVAGILHARDILLRITSLPSGVSIFGDVFSIMLADNKIAIALSQFFIAGISAYILFLIINRFLSPKYSLWLLVSYQLNITFFSLILKIDYSLLETLFILLIFYLSRSYIDHSQKYTRKSIILGGFIGIFCLFRPVYLLFPAFFFLFLLLIQKRWTFSAKHSMIVLLAMLIAMTPNIIRNYLVADKLILTSEQGGVELYHNSVVSFFESPEYTDYGKVWGDYGWPLIRDNLGYEKYSGILWYSDTARISELFWSASIRELRKQPLVYMTNVIYNVQQIIRMDFEYWGYRFYKQSERQIFGYQAFHIYLTFLQIIGVISLLASLLVTKEPRYRKTMLFLIALLFISYSLVYFYPRYIYLKYPLYFISFGALISCFQSTWKVKTAAMISSIYLLAIFVVGFIPLAFFSYVVFFLNA